MTTAGYAIATSSRAFLLVITAWPLVAATRFADQFGVGLRTSPRDALMADSAPEGSQGGTFGRLRAMEALGAAGSTAMGAAVIFLVQGNRVELRSQTFHILVGIGIVFGVAAILVAALKIREVTPRSRAGLDLEARGRLPGIFIVFLAINVFVSLGTSSDVFLMLRTQGLGASTLVIVAGLAGFNLVYAAIASRVGNLSDRVGKRRLIAAGWILSAISYLGFAFAGSLVFFVSAYIPYGIATLLTAGIAQALIADIVPAGSRGAAYGIFYGILGLAGLSGAALAGALYQFSVAAPFLMGAVVSLLAVGLLALVRLPQTSR
jgi:MFS family permease